MVISITSNQTMFKNSINNFSGLRFKLSELIYQFIMALCFGNFLDGSKLELASQKLKRDSTSLVTHSDLKKYPPWFALVVESMKFDLEVCRSSDLNNCDKLLCVSASSLLLNLSLSSDTNIELKGSELTIKDLRINESRFKGVCFPKNLVSDKLKKNENICPTFAVNINISSENGTSLAFDLNNSSLFMVELLLIFQVASIFTNFRKTKVSDASSYSSAPIV